MSSVTLVHPAISSVPSDYAKTTIKFHSRTHTHTHCSHILARRGLIPYRRRAMQEPSTHNRRANTKSCRITKARATRATNTWSDEAILSLLSPREATLATEKQLSPGDQLLVDVENNSTAFAPESTTSERTYQNIGQTTRWRKHVYLRERERERERIYLPSQIITQKSKQHKIQWQAAR